MASRVTTGEKSPHFCPKSISKSWCKVCSQRENLCFETIPHRILGKFRVTWQSQNQNGVYMLCMWIACEIAVKTARNFHFRTKYSLKWIILESRQRNEEKGNPFKLHIEFYFQLCTSHNLHCNFSKFCSVVAHREFKP